MADNWVSDELFKQGRIIELQKGEVLHSDYDKCSALGKVVSGKLRLSRPLSTGREIVLKEFLPEELFAELIVFTGENYPGWLIASEVSTVIEVDYQHVLDTLSSRDALVTFISGISKKMNHLRDKIEIISHKTVKQKIAFSLLTDGRLRLPSITQNADYLGCSREALSRALSELEAAGVIVREKGAIRIKDRKSLEELF
ncbi:MAG: Crp/Fnr family transcriptional regulator [Spirochaetales bacterium]|nr:Crp/Fnr family transcriptional regulator [Spirochaetales bacterium]